MPLKNDSAPAPLFGCSEPLLRQKSHCGVGARDFFSKICFPQPPREHFSKMRHLPVYALCKIVLWWQWGRHFCFFENCLFKNLLLVRVSSIFLYLQISYALQISSDNPLAMQKVRVPAFWGLVCLPSAGAARAVGFDASSRSLRSGDQGPLWPQGHHRLLR